MTCAARLLFAACNGLLGLDEPTLRETAEADLPTCAHGWAYVIPIAIDNRSAARLTEHQVRIVIDTASPILEGAMRTDGGDVRFTVDDGSIVIPHVIERDLGTTGTMMWIKVPVIPPGASRVLLHHGNPTALSVTATADVFEAGIVANPSFESGGGWSLTPPETPPSRWHAVWPSTNYSLEGTSSFDFILEYDMITVAPMHMAIGQTAEFPAGSDHVLRFDLDVIAASPGELGGRFVWTAGGPEVFRLDGLHRENTAGRYLGLETIAIAPGSVRLAFEVVISNTLGGYATGYLDNVRVRKLARPEPTIMVGARTSNCP